MVSDLPTFWERGMSCFIFYDLQETNFCGFVCFLGRCYPMVFFKL